ncbi:MAG: hypothetical protein COV01_03790 [Candidatus Taylorbacteria bacterium CG10_big_fil_rev_8_21_14_0_10_41_48]|uniref:Uncharacterized protein n=1 Tax=Candidatus Taylorbacteria bacterium CG10_big_fil_rev_8_21_14_0_10_41_48 TaxID=1975024 RepID=A0A2M8LBD9_9BACT|nr:MAG: hypothetical protein COV01_03790 [Candidatus Taylorbacteria bacterium CG10_big_fil_rev_8_21_14_0_10_41_48]
MSNIPDILYVVVSRPNSRDTSMCNEAVRVTTGDPLIALNIARATERDHDHNFISIIMVFRIKFEHAYTMKDFSGHDDNGKENLVYISHNSHDYGKDWPAYFRGEFARLFGEHGEKVNQTVQK